MPTRAGSSPRSAASLCGALAGNQAAQKDVQALRSEHLADMKAWHDTYGQDPSSAQAQAALTKLRTEHWNDMLALMKKYGVSAGAGAGPGMMGGNGSGSGWRSGAGYGGGMMRGSGLGMMGGGY